MRISDWSSDVCSSDLPACLAGAKRHLRTADSAALSSREWPLDSASFNSWTVPSGPTSTLMATVPCSRSLRDSTGRSEEHTSELQSLMRISYAVFCLKKKKKKNKDRFIKKPKNEQNNMRIKKNKIITQYQ